MATSRQQLDAAARRITVQARHHPEIDFGGFTDLDGTLRFYARVRELLTEDGVALDVGCGRGTQGEDPVMVRRGLRTLVGNCRRVIGIDVDPAGAANRFIDEFRLIEDEGHWPVADAAVDLALADFVVEHVTDPDAFFTELERVIRPGGYACIRTINAHSYVGLASRMTPISLHSTVLRRAQPGREGKDVFSTHYRCNTRRALTRALDEHGFDPVVYAFEDEPSYLTISSPLYRLGLLHRRLAPRSVLVGLLAWGRRRHTRA